MKCEKVRDRLMTGYADKELGPEENVEVEQHLTACSGCREFFGTVQRSAVAPFKKAGEIHPDSVVWQRIQEKIEKEQALSQGWLRKLADVFVLHPPFPISLMRGAFVTALLLAAVMLVKWPSNHVDPVYGYLSEQMAFMGELGSGNTDLLNGDLRDYDTVFEELGA